VVGVVVGVVVVVVVVGGMLTPLQEKAFQFSKRV
jgi:hypothetical protein